MIIVSAVYVVDGDGVGATQIEDRTDSRTTAGAERCPKCGRIGEHSAGYGLPIAVGDTVRYPAGPLGSIDRVAVVVALRPGRRDAARVRYRLKSGEVRESWQVPCQLRREVA